MRKSRAFTLVELMMAVVIIGILCVIAVPNYTRSVEQAKCSQSLHNLETLRTAAMTYYSQNQTFVGMTIANLAPLIGTSAVADNDDWHYSIPTATAAAFTIRAIRQRGPQANAGRINLDINQDDHFNPTPVASSYPFDDPTNW